VRQALQKNYKKGTFKMKKANKGFTLAEIITVVALLAILSVIGVVIFTNLQEQVRQAIVRSDAATLARQLNTANSVVGGVIVLADVSGMHHDDARQFTIQMNAGPVGTLSGVSRVTTVENFGLAISNCPMNLSLTVSSEQPWNQVIAQITSTGDATLRQHMFRTFDTWQSGPVTPP
jgi:prepilin-type N-terminal cleavage/methylation domain-containing protein